MSRNRLMFKALNLRKSPSTVYLSTSSRSVVSSSSLSSRVRLFSTPCTFAASHLYIHESACCRMPGLAHKLTAMSTTMHADTHRFHQDGLCCCMANTKDVLQRKFYALLIWDLYSTNTSTFNAQRWSSNDLHCTLMSRVESF